MHVADYIQVALYIGFICVLTPPLGSFAAKVLMGERTFLSPVFSGFEKAIYKLSGIDSQKEMSWQPYCGALLLFNGIAILVLFLLQLFQKSFPLNPQYFSGVSWPLSLNTAVSFVTNTNWQAYAGETTMSYCTQMLGLAVQNFLSAATGIAVFAALARGLSRRSMSTIGNFWTDLVRSTVYILLPLSLVFALVLASQGVVQTFAPYAKATTVEGQKQTIPLGPAASQIAIKQLGTNGGGFFNVNSAHPFENPTPLSNFLEMLAILLLPAALTYSFGTMVGSQRQGWALFAAMLLLFILGLTASSVW